MLAQKLAPRARALVSCALPASSSSCLASVARSNVRLPDCNAAHRHASSSSRSPPGTMSSQMRGPSKTNAQLGKSASSSSPSSVAASTTSGQSSAGTAARRKLTPTAKAKAQASASRALREQIQATMGAQEDGNEKSIVPGQTRGDSSTEESIDEAIASIARRHLESSAETHSQPIRRLRDVVAFATAEQYDFEALVTSGRLPADWQLIEDGDVIYVPHWPPQKQKEKAEEGGQGVERAEASPTLATSIHGGEAFIFRSGSYVTWGMSLEQSRKFLRAVIKGRSGIDLRTVRPVEINAYGEVGNEGMEFIMAGDQVTRIVGDIIVLGRPPKSEEEEIEGRYTDEPVEHGLQGQEDPDWTPLLARVAFSQGLARSARLSVQEAALASYLEEVAAVPGRLEAEGKVPLPRRQVIRKMGTLLKLRQSANLDTENFLDDPEMYWDNAQLEHHYDSICIALDIESRFNAYNEKLDHGENLLGVLRALLTEASTHRMELIIIYLIAFEVCLALISHDYIPSPSAVMELLKGSVGVESSSHLQPTASGQVEIPDTDADNSSIPWWKGLFGGARSTDPSTSLLQGLQDSSSASRPTQRVV